ncbi:DNA polymerase Y family protein [Clostridium vitabionis]|jgi:DNA polymerase-4|uniref:DNA polymerase Y family protein n=1 Tax=Clostridium vitabionis TaxID=2784388 RepID=UPI00188B580A|nr:DNA polymerase IV [Clostridium vitabionis]
MAERVIFHVDVNSAFLSWTSVKRLEHGESDLRDIPAVIGGDPGKRTSIVTAKSIPAKKLGIRTGEPVSMALRKCPDLVIVPSDFAWYRECSRRFIAACRNYSPDLEQFSIDECFLDMSGMRRIFPDLLAAAGKLKDEIRDTLGFTVNVGVGSNKLLAKMASDFEKPDKVHTLFTKEIPAKLWPLPVPELLFVGRASAELLARNGIRTIGDLASADTAYLAGLVGRKAAEQYHAYANGIDDAPVQSAPPEAKGFSVSTTTEEDVTERAEAHAILKDLADSVASRMRRAGYRAYGVSVQIRAGDYSVRVNRSRQTKLENPTDITREVWEVSCRLFDSLWDGRTGLRLLGIRLFGLTTEDSCQLDLFGTQEKREKEERADRALDAIRGKFGRGAISLGPRGNLAGRLRDDSREPGGSEKQDPPGRGKG